MGERLTEVAEIFKRIQQGIQRPGKRPKPSCGHAQQGVPECKEERRGKLSRSTAMGGGGGNGLGSQERFAPAVLPVVPILVVPRLFLDIETESLEGGIIRLRRNGDRIVPANPDRAEGFRDQESVPAPEGPGAVHGDIDRDDRDAGPYLRGSPWFSGPGALSLTRETDITFPALVKGQNLHRTYRIWRVLQRLRRARKRSPVDWRM